MGKKTAQCSSCNTAHQRPVGKKCGRRAGNTEGGIINNPPTIDDTTTESRVSAADSVHGKMDQVLKLLSDIGSKQQAMEERVIHLETSASFQHSSPQRLSPVRPNLRQYNHDGIVPSLDTLRNTHDVQAQVAARLRDLQQSQQYTGNTNSNSKIKSGRFRGVEAPVLKHVTWPQELVYVGASRHTVAYDDLTPEQFTVGFLKSVQLEKSQETRDRMIEYVIKLYQTAVDVSWNVALGSNAVLYQEMEKDRLHWTHVDQIDRITNMYTQRAVVTEPKAKVQAQAQSTPTKRTVCMNYNSGKCVKDDEHLHNNTWYRHVCSHCFRTVRKSFNHPEYQCNRKKNPSTISGGGSTNNRG